MTFVSTTLTSRTSKILKYLLSPKCLLRIVFRSSVPMAIFIKPPSALFGSLIMKQFNDLMEKRSDWDRIYRSFNIIAVYDLHSRRLSKSDGFFCENGTLCATGQTIRASSVSSCCFLYLAFFLTSAFTRQSDKTSRALVEQI